MVLAEFMRKMLFSALCPERDHSAVMVKLIFNDKKTL
jgi:hypothetical protein